MCKHSFCRLWTLATVSILMMAMLSCGGRKQIVDVDELHRRDSLESAQDTLQLIDEIDQPPVAVDGLFDDFFFTFVTNQSFQMQRIRFPLPVSDGEKARTVGSAEWDNYNKFIFQDQFAVITEDDDDLMVKNDTSVNRVSVEWIDLQQEIAEVYTFRKENKVWMLSTVNRTGLDELPNGEFLTFFSHFVCDSVFQQHSIDEPLQVVTSLDTEDEESVDLKYDITEWPLLRKEFPLPHHELVNIDYGQPSKGVRYKQLMLQSMTEDLFLKFKFHKYRSDWKLIGIEN